jgi:hypothetical protein
VSTEERADPYREASTDFVVREAVIEEAAPLRLAPMPFCILIIDQLLCLALLDDDLIDPTFVLLSMESWCRTENWIKVCCEYPEFTCLSVY